MRIKTKHLGYRTSFRLILISLSVFVLCLPALSQQPADNNSFQHYEGRSINHHGLPRFRNASFESTYPFGIVNLSDSTMPLLILK